MASDHFDLMAARLRVLEAGVGVVGDASVSAGKRFVGASPKAGLASRAAQEAALGDKDYDLRLRALLYTHWAHVMERFRRIWVALRLEFVGSFELVYKSTGSEIDERIAGKLLSGIEDFSQFLLHFEIFLQQFRELDVLPEERLLSTQNFIIELGDFCRREVEVANLDGSAKQLSGTT